MSSAAFIDFSANSATEGGSVTCSWVFNPSYVTRFNAKHIYLYQTDTNLDSSSVELGQTHVVPLVDPDTNLLNTSYTVQGLTNGYTYLFSCEVTVKPTLTPSAPNTTSVYNSATVEVIPTSPPDCPNFFLSQNEDFSFTVKLSVTAPPDYEEPTPISQFDGYSELTGVYVVYSNGLSIKTDYFANDSSTNVYTDDLVVDVSDGYYEVAVSTENIAADGTYRRSCLSPTQYIFVDEEPGPPRDVSAIQQIVVDPNAIPPHMLIEWTAPSYVGNPPVDSYYIYRSLDASYVYVNAVPSTDLSYVDTSGVDVLVPGTYYTYSIYAHNTDGLSDASATSLPVLAWTYPNQVLNLELLNETSTSLLAEWDPAPNVTGLPDEDLLYELILTDASGDHIEGPIFTSDLSYSFTDLEQAVNYVVTVYAGITYNSVDYFNPVSPSTANNYAHDSPLPVTNLVLQNVSSSSLNAIWDAPSAESEGLTVDPSGAYSVYLDTSFVSKTNELSQSFSGLNEFQLYEVSVYANYIITGTSIPIQSLPETAAGAPHGAPPASLLTAVATNTLGAGGSQQGETVLLNWTLDSSYADYTTETAIWRQIIDTSNGAIVTDPSFQLIATVGDYVSSFTDTGVGDASSIYFVNGNLMTYFVVITYTDNGFTPPSTYNVTSNDAFAIPYSQGPQPVITAIDSGNTTLELFWDAISSSSLVGTGLELQGYKMYLNNVYTLNQTGDTHFTFTDLSNNVQYSVGVAAFYNVGAGGYFAGTQTTSFVSDISGVPHATPFPDLAVTATNNRGVEQSQQGKTVLLSWNVDVIPFHTNTTAIWRQITDISGDELAPFEVIDTVGNGVNSFIDDASNNIGNVNFLNGNIMTYYVDLSYVDVSSGDTFNIVSDQRSAIPYSRPTPCDASGIPVDLSLCIIPVDLSSNGTFTTFTTTVNKNGRNISTFVAVGLASDTSAPVIVFDQAQLDAISYSNDQLNGVCAKNQVAQITLTFETGGGAPVNVTDVLDVISNIGGSLVAAYPSDGAFNLEG